MSVDPQDFIRGDVLSECCGAPALGEIADDGFGICAECKEHAFFENPDEEDSQ